MKRLVREYASTLVEGLVIAVAFALVDRAQSGAMTTTVMAGGAGMVLGVFVGLTIAERGNKPGSTS